ncbi:MAG: RNA polymerase subunit sigma, partial [Candidatus Afipia apatlaquensis]|nr:RNA polymerase subunit sigma [Candidatus Afipia apatlaquensis]
MTQVPVLDARTDSPLLDHARGAQLTAALTRCTVGDRSALQMIYDSESARMVGVARRILMRQDLAEEAVHDAFVRIWRGAGGFDPHRGSAIGWLYAIVRNCALTIHRNEHRYDHNS